MSIKFRWLGYACFEVVLPSGKVLVTDPYIDYSSTAPIRCEEVTGADYVAITHGHFDHVTDVGPLVKRFGSRVVCSHQVAGPLARLFDLPEGDIVKVTAGDTVDFDDLTIEVRRGEHIDLRALMASRGSGDRPTGEVRPAISAQMPGDRSQRLAEMRGRMQAVGLEAGEQLTFVFRAGDNLRICLYSSGAYDFLRQEVVDARANVFLAQLGGMMPARAAELAALSGADVIIPTHHDGTGEEVMRSSSRRMAEHLAKRTQAQFLDIVPGRWYRLGVGAALA